MYSKGSDTMPLLEPIQKVKPLYLGLVCTAL